MVLHRLQSRQGIGSGVVHWRKNCYQEYGVNPSISDDQNFLLQIMLKQRIFFDKLLYLGDLFRLKFRHPRNERYSRNYYVRWKIFTGLIVIYCWHKFTIFSKAITEWKFSIRLSRQTNMRRHIIWLMLCNLAILNEEVKILLKAVNSHLSWIANDQRLFTDDTPHKYFKNKIWLLYFNLVYDGN